MDWPTFILLGLSISSAPEHRYTYTYTDPTRYSEQLIGSGTDFFTPRQPVVDLTVGLIFDDNTSVVLGLESAFDAPKLHKAPSVEMSIIHFIPLENDWSISFSASAYYQGKIIHHPCTDSLANRTFHCFHGVTPSSPYFAQSFDTTAQALSKRFIGITSIGVQLTYSF